MGTRKSILRMITNNFSDFREVPNVSNNKTELRKYITTLSLKWQTTSIVSEDDRTGNHEIFYRSLNLR